MKCRFIFIFLLLITPVFLFGQIKPTIHYTEEDGLAGNSVRDIIKDNDGYMWIATDNGLSKFNGNSFKNFYKSDGLLGNRVWALTVDDENSVWAGCYMDGLVKIKDNQITAQYNFNDSINNNTIRKLYYSNYYNRLFVGTEQGLYYLNDTVLKTIVHSNELAMPVTSIIEYNHRIFFTVHGGTLGGLFEVVSDDNNFCAEIIEKGTRMTCSVINDTIYSSFYNEIYYSPLSNLNNIDTIRLPKELIVWSMDYDTNNCLWLSSLGGELSIGKIKKIDIRKKQLKDIEHNIESNAFYSIYCDKSTIWSGSSENGLFIINQTPFEYLSFSEIKGIVDFIYYENGFLILTKDNIYKSENGELRLLFSKQDLLNKLIKQRNTNFYNFRKNIWVQYVFSNYELQLSHFLKQNNKIYLVTNKGTISIPNFKDYFPFDFGSFYLGEKGGIYYVRNYRNMIYIPDLNNSASFFTLKGSQGVIRDILEIDKSKESIFLASYFNGLYSIYNDSIFYLNKYNSRFDNNLSDMDIDSKGEVWCSSSDGNLFQVGFKDSLYIIRKYNESDGIKGNNIKWIKFNTENLYIGTNKGLNIIPKKQLYENTLSEIYFFNENNGYEWISANNPKLDDKGNVYVQTFDKIIKINKDRFPDSKNNLIVDNIRINDKEININELNHQDLSYRENNISLDFLVIKYPSGKNIKYQYQVNDNDWQTGNEINLQSLSPDNYTIKLRAIDLENNLTYLKMVSFKINQPFWYSWWFISLIVLIIISVTLIVIRKRILKEQEKQAEKDRITKGIAELKIRSLQGQMNPHFIFNSLNSIQNSILSSNVKGALTYLGKLAGLIRTNLKNLGENFIPIEQEIEFLKQYLDLEKMRFKDQFEIIIEDKVQNKNALVPPMIVQPVLENAIKHGLRNKDGKGLLKINITQTSDSVNFIIADNGIGRIASQEIQSVKKVSGVGIKLIEERLKLLNDQNNTNLYFIKCTDLKNDNNVPLGTKVEINFKFNS